jgi:hypothetical protein
MVRNLDTGASIPVDGGPLGVWIESAVDAPPRLKPAE